MFFLIEPVNGYTSKDVCKALNDGYAAFLRLCPPLMHGCGSDRPENAIMGTPDPDKVIAKVLGNGTTDTKEFWVASLRRRC